MGFLKKLVKHPKKAAKDVRKPFTHPRRTVKKNPFIVDYNSANGGYAWTARRG